jgi:hypothetical protein
VPILGERLSQIAKNVDKINNLSNDIHSDDVESLDSGN